METERHRAQMNVLIESLQLAWADRDDFYVGGNMAIYFSELQVKKNDFRGPDVFVVLDTAKREHRSWVVWQEGGRTPDVVIELLSESTEKVDRGDKMRIYARLLRVPNYYLFDPLTGLLEGYALDVAIGAYARMEPDPSGDFSCPPLGLQVGVRQAELKGISAAWMRWIDAKGQVLITPEEHAREAVAEAQAAKAQAQAAKAQADAAKVQADAAKVQADAAKAQADALAAKLAEYEKKFGPLPGEGER
ncbi:Uma2 family endonuclease [Chondromyces apiculatus]|nr:Uma2 family endonuclease [Chondromyces apiculatus]